MLSTPRINRIILAAALLIIISTTLFFSKLNPISYLTFLRLCQFSSGAETSEPLIKNAGWEAEDYFHAVFIAQFKHVGFVRYYETRLGENKYYDLKYTSGEKNDPNSYSRKESDFSLNVLYGIKTSQEFFSDYTSIEKVKLYFFNINKPNHPLAEHTDFKYNFPKKSIFYRKNWLSNQCNKNLADLRKELNQIFQ